MESALRGETHRHQRGAGRSDDPVIGDVIGLRHDDLIAERCERQHGGAQGILGPGSENDLFGQNVATGSPGIMSANGSDYRWLAAAVGVTRAPGTKFSSRLLDDGGGCLALWLADRQEQDIVAPQGLFAGTEMNVPFLRAEPGEAISHGGVSHAESF